MSERFSHGPSSGAGSADLDRLLRLNTTKPARERLTLIRVFEELRGIGYEGGYDTRTSLRPGLGENVMPAIRPRPSCRSPLRPARPTSSTGATTSC